MFFLFILKINTTFAWYFKVVMVLTKTTEYAVRVLAYMANNESRVLFSAKSLHENLKIPYKYLTRLMTNLAKHGYLTSVKGRAGGFMLKKKPNEISLSDIIGAVEGMDSFSKCILGFDDCSDDNPCALHFIWEKTKKQFLEVLENTTLEDIKNAYITKF